MAADSRKTRKSNFSSDEISVLISTVMHNYDILYGETSKSFYHKEARNQVWNIVLEEVNKVSLDRRTLAEVKNKWKKCQYRVRNSDTVDSNTSITDFDELDSMPLQQRLSQNTSHSAANSSAEVESSQNEPVLQSQPISPTKLKVTRQGAKPQIHYAKTSTPSPPIDKVCLKWDNHHSNMQSAFPSLLLKEQYVDATLVSEGKTLKCHRMILSACSPYFEEVLNGISPLQHPVLFMRDIAFWVLKALCDFMYAGEVHILQENLEELLAVATALKIKGLALTKDSQEDLKHSEPVEIKQEIDVAPTMVIKKEEEKPAREEKQYKEEVKHDPKQEIRNKRREDRRTKHQNQIIKEALTEVPPPKLMPKLPQKMVQKVVQKMVQKVLPKVCNSKSAIKNVSKSSTSKSSREGSKKNEKHKQENILLKDKDKEKPLKKNEHINDPLDLLEPVYEEIAKEEPPLPPKISTKNINPAKFKENKGLPLKKGIKKVKEETSRKKVKKRRYADYNEDRDESPSPTFQSRKGTRSRPNVKIPKFFHTSYEDSPKETTDGTIVRVPHTDQNDPLIGAEMESIKAEPFDLEDSTIEVEENIVNYITPDQELTSQECEEIIGSYDSPIVNIQREAKRNIPNYFKKILVSDPVIMDVHTVTESEQSDVSLLNITNEAVEIIDVADIASQQNQLEESLDRNNCDPLSTQDKTTLIKISNVQTVAEDAKKDEFFEAVEQDISETIEDNYLEENEEIVDSIESLDEHSNQFEHSTKSTMNIKENDSENKQEQMGNSSSEMNFKIESVVSQSQELIEIIPMEESMTTIYRSKVETGKVCVENEQLNDSESPESVSNTFLENVKEKSRNNDFKAIDDENIDLLQSTTELFKNNLEKDNIKTEEHNLQKSIPLNNEIGEVPTKLEETEVISEKEVNLESEHINTNDEKLNNADEKMTDDYNQEIDDQSTPLIVIKESTNNLMDFKDNENSEISQPDSLSQESFNKDDTKQTISENIEAELVECLASTSELASKKPVESLFKISDATNAMPCDFSQDTELNNLVSKNRPANILEDKFETNFPITDLKDSNKTEEDNISGSSVKDCKSNVENVDMQNKEEILLSENITGISKEIENKTELLNNQDEMDANAADKNTENLITHPIVAESSDQLVVEQDLAGFSASSPLQSNFIEDNLLAHSPQTSDLPLPIDPTDNKQLEESLLDLDDDIMKDTSDNQDGQGHTEKTLEMIVNDLNESLGTSND